MDNVKLHSSEIKGDSKTIKTINIPVGLHRKLKVHAAAEGKSLQELVIETLSAALGRDPEA